MKMIFFKLILKKNTMQTKKEKVDSGLFFLEHTTQNIGIFIYKEQYVYMDEDGTHMKMNLPDDVESDVWKVGHMRGEPLSKMVERIKYKWINFGSTLKVVYCNDQNIFTKHSNRMELGDFLSTLFYDMNAPVTELTDQEIENYTKRVDTMTGFVMSHYPDLSILADIRDTWAIELYKLDIRGYGYTSLGEVGTRLENICEKLEGMGKQEQIRTQFNKTFEIYQYYPLDTQFDGGIPSVKITMMQHYIESIKYDPGCWQPDLFELLSKYTDGSETHIKMLKEHARTFIGISKDLN